METGTHKTKRWKKMNYVPKICQHVQYDWWICDFINGYEQNNIIQVQSNGVSAAKDEYKGL